MALLKFVFACLIFLCVGQLVFSASSENVSKKNHSHHHSSHQPKVHIVSTDIPSIVQGEPSRLPSKNSTGVILPVLVMACILLFAIVAVVYNTVTSKMPQELLLHDPEEQPIAILCNSDTGEYEYKIIFRVGCPTPKFDMKRGFIDFEVLGPDNEVLGHPVRFKCCLLRDHICSEMHSTITSAMQLPPITGVRAHHGEPSESIFFYGYVLFNLAEDSVIEERVIMQNITNKPTVFKGHQVTSGIEKDKEEEDEYAHLLVQWTRIELVIVSCSLVLIIVCIVMMFEYFGWYFGSAAQEDGSLICSLLDILFVTPIGLGLMFAIIYSYKCIKKKIVIFEYTAENPESGTEWQVASKTFLVGLIAISLAASIGCVIMGKDISFIKSLFWLAGSLVVCVNVIGVWILFELWMWLKNPKAPVAVENGGRSVSKTSKNATSSRHSIAPKIRYAIRSSNIADDKTKTIYFMPISSYKRSSGRSITTKRTIGWPKLISPKLEFKSKAKMKTQIAKFKCNAPKTKTAKRNNNSDSSKRKKKKGKGSSAKGNICKSNLTSLSKKNTYSSSKKSNKKSTHAKNHSSSSRKKE